MSANPRPARILIVVAMEAEARPVRAALGLHAEPASLHPAFPSAMAADGPLAVATNGTDPRFEIDAIASQPAVVTTLTAAESHRPDLVISAGTAGGFEGRGGAIGDVFVSTEPVRFHDRRVDIPGWDAYGEGSYPVADLGPERDDLLSAMGAKPGRMTTGNSLDAPPVDLATMDRFGADAKDMEAAAVAWVCEHLGVDFLAVKAITDLVDHPEATAEQFRRNLGLATERLAAAVGSLVGALCAA
ncbi:MAG: 5'-methylthioadenosine nucleosidase [Acidimicrobiales bacterium]